MKLEGKIAVAVDGSAPSRAALDYAAELAHRLGGLPLVVLHVLETQKIGYWLFIDEHFRKELERRADELVLAARKAAAKRGLPLETHILPGTGQSAYEALAGFLEDNPEVSHLVLGDHGVGLTDRHILGSTTERLIREVSARGLPVALVVVPGEG
jgi:nucleotide-binding universal stress UspA family protein